MTDQIPDRLERLLDQVPVGRAPVGHLLTAGHAAHRRKRRTVVAGVVVTAVTILGGTVAASSLTANRTTDTPIAAIDPAQPVVLDVRTSLSPESPEVHYYEGALAQVIVDRSGGGAGVRLGPDRVGFNENLDRVEPGTYTIDAALRPCSGSCGSLDPTTDSCRQDAAINRDSLVEVVFHYGQPCTITVTSQAPAPPETGDDQSVVLEGDWVVRALTDAQGAPVPLPDEHLPLRFRNGALSGETECNSIFGTYEQTGPSGRTLTFPRRKLGSTLVGCGESPLIGRLLDVRGVAGSGDVLRLQDADGAEVAEIARPSAPSPLGPDEGDLVDKPVDLPTNGW